MTSSARDIPSQVTNSCWVWARQKGPANSSGDTAYRIGKWMLFRDKVSKDSDGLTELDRAWFSLTPLVEQKILHGAKCSTAVSDDIYVGVIICYTADYEDQTQVRAAAEAIHKIINLKSPMYYKTDIATSSGLYIHLGHKNVSMYRFCPDCTFYKRGTTPSSWVLISDETSADKETPPASLVPSKVTWMYWLWAAPEIPLEDSEGIYGKWLLFLNQEEKDSDGMTELDRAWPSVARLVNDGILVNATCCTAAAPSYSNPTIGVIVCYTSDFTDKVKVKASAEAIHYNVRLPGTIYYKAHDPSGEGTNVSIYKYCPDCKFYERDEEFGWRLVVDE